jgi:hypothetical protein
MATTKTEDPRALLREHDHAEGCPDRRAEAYILPVPRNQGGGVKRVVRCIDCGGHRTMKGE